MRERFSFCKRNEDFNRMKKKTKQKGLRGSELPSSEMQKHESVESTTRKLKLRVGTF
jgi:hypothetical protein